MRNMIFKTLFASILGSLFIAPLAHADRQGGGTLRVANFDFVEDTSLSRLHSLTDAIETNTEWVRLKSVDKEKVAFDYIHQTETIGDIQQMVLSRSNLSGHQGDLIDALIKSKFDGEWHRISSK